MCADADSYANEYPSFTPTFPDMRDGKCQRAGARGFFYFKFIHFFFFFFNKNKKTVIPLYYMYRCRCCHIIIHIGCFRHSTLSRCKTLEL